MNVRCPKCHKVFEANKAQKKLIDNAKSKGQRLVMLACSECFKDIPINPEDLLSFESQKDKPVQGIKYQGETCPICKEDIISYVDDGDEKFWGCGECGNVWFKEKDLEKELKK
jgi:DNA-directed RNA polymerase subunit M/transcription elongation factor TFIIS